MIFRALVLTVTLAPTLGADFCDICTNKTFKEIESCGAFWTPSKYVGEFAEGEDDWMTAPTGGCKKNICCAEDKTDCCENDVGAILGFTFGILGIVLCCVVTLNIGTGACGPTLKRGGRYVVLGFLAFLCAAMQCVAFLRGPIWAYAQFKYKYEATYSGGNRSWSEGWTETNDLWFYDKYDGDASRMHYKEIVKEDVAHSCDWDPPGANKKCKRLMQAIITARYTTGVASLLMLSCAVIMFSIACGCRFHCCCASCPNDATERTFVGLAGLLAVGGLIGLTGASNFSSEYYAVTKDLARFYDGHNISRRHIPSTGYVSQDGVSGDDYYVRRWDTDLEVDEVVSCHWGCAFSILSGICSILVAGVTLCLGNLRPLQQDPLDDKPLLAAGETDDAQPVRRTTHDGPLAPITLGEYLSGITLGGVEIDVAEEGLCSPRRMHLVYAPLATWYTRAGKALSAKHGQFPANPDALKRWSALNEILNAYIDDQGVPPAF